MSIRGVLRQFKAERSERRAVVAEASRRKEQARTTGQSDVSSTCQITDLRALYQRIGLARDLGYFVEIGAFDGESYSNTSFLADQGWRGLYVEPIPQYAKLVRYRHHLNEVRVEQLAVSGQAGSVEFAVMGALTTMNRATENAYDDIEWAQDLARQKTRITVKTETLAAVLTRNLVPIDFELLVVDVEGAELAIIEQLVASQWRPRAMIVELADRHGSFSKFPDLVASHGKARTLIHGAGYAEAHSDEINTIFVRV